VRCVEKKPIDGIDGPELRGSGCGPEQGGKDQPE
jgi:hypothetical protein